MPVASTTATRLPVVATIIAAYWDFGRVLKVLWAPALMALALFIAAQFSGVACVRLWRSSYVGAMLLKELIDFGSLVLIAPFLIVLHRFIQFGKITLTYEFTTHGPRLRAFAAWLLVLGLIASVPFVISILTTQTGVVYYTVRPAPEAAAIAKFLMLAIVTAIFIAVTRLMSMLPAAAADAPGITLNSALADTRHNAGRIAGAAFLSVVPLICFFLATAFLARHALPSRVASLVIYPMLKVTSFAAIALAAALASRVYLTLGDRLNQQA